MSSAMAFSCFSVRASLVASPAPSMSVSISLRRRRPQPQRRGVGGSRWRRHASATSGREHERQPHPQRHDRAERATSSSADDGEDASSSASAGAGADQPSRRSVAVAAVSAAVLARGAPPFAHAAMDPIQSLTRRGMAKFIQNDVEGSIADFDLIIDNAPSRAPYLWQRGLSLYYADRFEEVRMRATVMSDSPRHHTNTHRAALQSRDESGKVSGVLNASGRVLLTRTKRKSRHAPSVTRVPVIPVPVYS